MDQIKIGNFLRELRKEKGMTQEQLAEKVSVARRTVSRWETGSNMPDLDILVELSDLYEVELRELLNGERTCEKMNKELKETVLAVAEYSGTEKEHSAKIVGMYFMIGIVSLISNFIMNCMELPDTFLTGLLHGFTFTLALGAMIMGLLYISGRLAKLSAFKKRLTGKDKEEEI